MWLASIERVGGEFKEEKEKLDKWYIRNASLWLDLRIIMMTIKVVLRGRISSQEILADTKQCKARIGA